MKVLLVLAVSSSVSGAPQDPHRIALACAQDAAQYCPDEKGRAALACLAQHHVSLRLVCRQALQAARPDQAPP